MTKSKKKRGIWRCSKFLPPVEKKHRITLGEGDTNLLKRNQIYFKCEFENPTGSFKDRGFAYQISVLKQKKIKQAVISSSGNAAISAAAYCKKAKISLTVFVSPKINRQKLTLIEKSGCRLVVTKRPISSAYRESLKTKAYNLRQSKDENAVYGYMTLGFELLADLEHIDAVFMPVSSGTGLVGIYKGFMALSGNASFHIVQTEAVCPIASLFDRKFKKRKESIADAIVAKYTPREDEIINLVEKTSGFGWVVSDKEIKKAKKILTKFSINSSYEGAAALAGLWKAKENGCFYKNSVVVLTGRSYDQNPR